MGYGKKSTGMEALHQAFEENGILSDTIELGDSLILNSYEEKTNDIPVAQEILRLMDLGNTIVTADAMNCQKDTVAAVTSQKGDYVLALKGNQPLFYDEVRNYFDAGTNPGRPEKERGLL